MVLMPRAGDPQSGAEHKELTNCPGDIQMPTSPRLQETLLNQFLLPLKLTSVKLE